MKKFYERQYDAHTRFATIENGSLNFGKPNWTSRSGLSGTTLFLSDSKPIMGFREDAINFSDTYFIAEDRFFVFSGHGSNPQAPSEIFTPLWDEDRDICGAVREGCRSGEEIKLPWWSDFGGGSIEVPDTSYYARSIQWALLRHWTNLWKEGFPTRYGVAIDVSAVFSALRENEGMKLPFFLLRPGIAAMPPYGNRSGMIFTEDGDFEDIDDWEAWDDLRSGDLPPALYSSYHKKIKIGCQTVDLYWTLVQHKSCDFPIDGEWYPGSCPQDYQSSVKLAFARHGIVVTFSEEGEVRLCRQ